MFTIHVLSLVMQCVRATDPHKSQTHYPVKLKRTLDSVHVNCMSRSVGWSPQNEGSSTLSSVLHKWLELTSWQKFITSSNSKNRPWAFLGLEGCLFSKKVMSHSLLLSLFFSPLNDLIALNTSICWRIVHNSIIISWRWFWIISFTQCWIHSI